MIRLHVARPKCGRKDLICIDSSLFLCLVVWICGEHTFIYFTKSGPGSSVGIATDYGLDGPGSNPGWDEIFRPSRPALGPPPQPPVKGVPCLSQG